MNLSIVNVQVEEDIKEEATNILNDLGLSMSASINIFLRQVIKNNGIPFKVENPKINRNLKKVFKELEKIERGKVNLPTYYSREELKKALLDE